MKIVVHGNKGAFRFTCDDCGCVFDAEKHEYKIITESNESVPEFVRAGVEGMKDFYLGSWTKKEIRALSRCPECQRMVYAKKTECGELQPVIGQEQEFEKWREERDSRKELERAIETIRKRYECNSGRPF